MAFLRGINESTKYSTLLIIKVGFAQVRAVSDRIDPVARGLVRLVIAKIEYEDVDPVPEGFVLAELLDSRHGHSGVGDDM